MLWCRFLQYEFARIHSHFWLGAHSSTSCQSPAGFAGLPTRLQGDDYYRRGDRCSDSGLLSLRAPQEQKIYTKVCQERFCVPLAVRAFSNGVQRTACVVHFCAIIRVCPSILRAGWSAWLPSFRERSSANTRVACGGGEIRTSEVCMPGHLLV